MLSQQTEEEVTAEAEAERREAVRRQKIAQSRILSAFISNGGELVEDALPGIGVVWRSKSRCGLIFDLETVDRWRKRKETEQRRLAKLELKKDVR